MNIHPIPQIPFIGDGATYLYELERKRNKVIADAAKELALVLGHAEGEFWSRTMPEQLANILESYERPGAIAAALGYLRQYGDVNFFPKGEAGHVVIDNIRMKQEVAS
jgi:hypothetical protein